MCVCVCMCVWMWAHVREWREGGKEGREQERSGGGGDGGWNRVRVTGIIHTIITVIIFV